MKVVMKGAAVFVLLTVILGMATPSFAGAPEATSSASEQPGSVIVFPKFMKGTVAVDGVMKAQTEIEVRARCPIRATCPEDEPVKIKFHWVCPGDDAAASLVCKAAGFDLLLSVNGKASFNPENPQTSGEDRARVAPCPSGYLIGWVISATSDRPIKYDGLTGIAVLRDGNGAIETYEAIPIPADPNLAIRADIATDIDPRTGSPALAFDGGAGHYQAVAGAIPANLEYQRLTGPLSTSEAALILLTLDVRFNRPNYPTVVDFDFRSDEGNWASTGRNFTCWGEMKNPYPDVYFALLGARTRNGLVLSGRAVKIPLKGISDIPGPVTLLGLVSTDEGGGRSMDPAYLFKESQNGRPNSVLVP